MPAKLCYDGGFCRNADLVEELEADAARLAEALREIVDLVKDARNGEYEIDYFTTQPAQAALAAYNAAVGDKKTERSK